MSKELDSILANSDKATILQYFQEHFDEIEHLMFFCSIPSQTHGLDLIMKSAGFHHRFEQNGFIDEAMLITNEEQDDE